MSKILKLNSYSQYDELGNRDYMVYEVKYNDGHTEYVSRDMFRNLKAFEIIKDKKVSVKYFIDLCKNKTYEEYISIKHNGMDMVCTDDLTQEEYNILKEVLL